MMFSELRTMALAKFAEFHAEAMSLVIGCSLDCELAEWAIS